ncbi:MAG: hypothetical protein E7372_00500 [Clostridiales bacterium]|nr:hypothetical protein [Clostridiales bacterium]
MKKALKVLFMVFASIFIAIFCLLIYFYITTYNMNLDVNKLVSFDRSVVFYDDNNNVVLEQSNGNSIVDSTKIPTQTKNAFISIEDKRFYSHNGIDYKGLFRAILSNLKSFSFKQGASTISQQLIKNTHLSSQKTLKRKLYEMKLAKQLENKYSKEEILEKYLNTIYFGENCYGILSASKHYFDKEPSELSLNESATLAGIIKAPTYYSPYQNYKRCYERKKVVLKQMLNQKLITKNEYLANLNAPINLAEKSQTNKGVDYFNFASNQIDKILNKSPYSLRELNVYTYINPDAQTYIENAVNNCTTNAHKTALLMDKNAHICAYYSTFGRSNRQIGSIIKPLVCYAPAIENDLVSSATKLSDTKTYFGDYSPKNYNGKYLGDISVKTALSTSSNVCAVKLLNYVGISKAKEYLNKLNIKTTKEDNSLCLALGSTQNGIDLIDSTGAYCVFNNNGKYNKPTFIKKITDLKGNVIYQNQEQNSKVFNDDTITIMNDMLGDVVQNGTAKKLKYCKQKLYAKTGTVGNKNGNTDAYTISYSNDYVMGVWLGNKNDVLLENNVTGGNIPSSISSEIWDKLYLLEPSSIEIIKSENVEEVFLDKIEYDNNNKLVLADDVCPLRYKFKALFKKSMIPKTKSTRFSCPQIEKPKISVNNNEIFIQLCLTQCINAKIFKLDGNKKIEVFDSVKNNSDLFVDKFNSKTSTYSYIVLPYTNIDGKIYYGKEIALEKIKSPIIDTDDWWDI